MWFKQLVVSFWCGAAAVAGVSMTAMADDAPVPSDELELAKAALRSLGADIPGTSLRCSGCHSVNLYNLNDMREQTNRAQWMCFGDDDARAPMDRINCMRENPADPTSRFSAARIGIYASGVHLQRFADMFKAAYPEAEWLAQYEAFKHVVQMPVSGENQMPEAEFDQVLQWTTMGMPHMERLVGNVPDAPRTCAESFSPELRAHVQRMQLEGWEAKNKENGIMMFACPDGGDKYSCFTQRNAEGGEIFPNAALTPFGASWNRDFAEAKIREHNESGHFPRPIVTVIEPLTEFYPAEQYHQDYARANPNQPYIQSAAIPKACKVREKHAGLVRPSH